MLCITDCRYFLILLNFHWLGRIYIFNTVCPETFRQLWCNTKYAPHGKTLTLFRFVNVIWTEISYIQIKKNKPPKNNKQNNEGENGAQCCKICKVPRNTKIICLKQFHVHFFNPIQRYYFSKDWITGKPGFN